MALRIACSNISIGLRLRPLLDDRQASYMTRSAVLFLPLCMSLWIIISIQTLLYLASGGRSPAD